MDKRTGVSNRRANQQPVRNIRLAESSQLIACVGQFGLRRFYGVRNRLLRPGIPRARWSSDQCPGVLLIRHDGDLADFDLCGAVRMLCGFEHRRVLHDVHFQHDVLGRRLAE